ncbi:unnamed protein product [Gordionus sp. m RMFG-2023]
MTDSIHSQIVATIQSGNFQLKKTRGPAINSSTKIFVSNNSNQIVAKVSPKSNNYECGDCKPLETNVFRIKAYEKPTKLAP